jgi:glycosyltransferase involved in cell wall biosynthesis
MQIWLPTVQARSGSDVYLERLAAGLRGRGHSPALQWFSHRAELTPRILRRARAPAGAQLVHANGWFGSYLKRPGLPLVAAELHCILDPEFEAILKPAQRLYYRCHIQPMLRRTLEVADAVTCISTYTARMLEHTTGRRADAMIHLWLDVERYCPAGPQAPEPDRQRPFRLLFVGNLSRRKGADVLEPLLRRLGPRFELWTTTGLRNRAIELPPNCKTLGHLTEDALIAAYRAADAVIIPSRYEGFSYVALEAMACSKPVLGFRMTALPEVVAEGTTGLLSALDDLDALAGNCAKLAADPVLAAQMGTAGRLRAVEFFDGRAALDAYVRLYSGLLR